jgi:ornithine cyclodeaminase
VLRRASVVVEYEPQTRIEGDIQQLSTDFPVVEFHRIVSGEKKGREFPSQVTVFDSVGFALEDFSALRYLHAVARERRIGIELDLIPAPQDPKDLFGLAVGKGQPELARPSLLMRA